MSTRPLTDRYSQRIRAVVSGLLLNNVRVVGWGFALGVVLNWVLRLLKPGLHDLMDTAQITGPYCIGAGILVIKVITAIRTRRLPMDPIIEDILTYIEHAKTEGQMTPEQIRMLYLKFYAQVLMQVSLDIKTQQEAHSIEVQLAQVGSVSAFRSSTSTIPSVHLQQYAQAHGRGVETETDQVVNDEEIAAQQRLLDTYRRTLRLCIQQQAMYGVASVPPNIVQEIYETRIHIQRIKTILRGWGATVMDYPDDTEANGAST